MFSAEVVFPQQGKHNVSFSAGLFSEDFNWSIAGNTEGKAPNIFSELIWKNLKGIQYNLNSNYFLTRRVAINVDLTLGNINNGMANDSDYLEDNRNQSFFDEDFLSNKGYFRNIKVSLLFRKELNEKLIISSLVGYDNLTQKLYLIEDPSNPTNEDLNSYYKHYWKGGYIGLDLNYLIGKFSVSGTITGGYYNYYAKANWNLIPTFKKPISFVHQANAYKYQGGLLLSYLISKNLEINSSVNFTYGASFAGKDEAFFTDNTSATTKFNGAELKNTYAKLGVNLIF